MRSVQTGVTGQIPSAVLSSLRESGAADSDSSNVVAVTTLAHHGYQILVLQLGNGKKYVFKRPSMATRYLKHEKFGLQVEAQVLSILANQTEIPVPELVRYHHSTTFIDLPYVLATHLQGQNLSSMSALSPRDQHSIDLSLGKHLRSLSLHHAAAFGDPLKVRDGKGYDSWRQAFTWVLESVLRDAEDQLVSLPFDVIRHLIVIHGVVLDATTQPRLVLLCTGKRDVLVDTETMQVTGLLGWGGVVWGDPWAAELLVCSGSEGMLEGFGLVMEEGSNGRVRRLL